MSGVCSAQGYLNMRRACDAGHVVAVRVTSEDANDGFKPTCGSIDELSFRTSPDVWGYFSVKSGGGIHEFSDSQVLLKSMPCAHLSADATPDPPQKSQFLLQRGRKDAEAGML